MIFEAAYGEGTPMGGSAFAQNLNKLSVDEVLSFRARSFTAGNLVISADGVSLADLEKAAADFTGAASVASASPYTGGCVRRRADFSGDVHVALALPSQSTTQSCGAFRVLHSVLASRLAERTKGSDLGCVTTHLEGGLECMFISSSSTASAEALVNIAIGELKAIAADGKSGSAKNKVALSNLVALEGGDGASSVMLAAHYAGVGLKDFADVRGVTDADVKNAAQSMLKAVPAYAVTGASYGMQSYASICSALK
jgi:hypothetical protein